MRINIQRTRGNFPFIRVIPPSFLQDFFFCEGGWKVARIQSHHIQERRLLLFGVYSNVLLMAVVLHQL